MNKDKYSIDIKDLSKQLGDLTSYYSEDDKLLFNSYLNNKLFANEKNIYTDEIIFPKLAVELIIRPECNQKCDYCYIARYGDKLYPKEERLDNKKTLKNIQYILDYFNSRKSYPTRWELFAGDLFYDDLWFDIMDIFYNYFVKLHQNVPQIFKQLREKKKKITIDIPSNYSFCHSNEKIKRIQKIIDKFKENEIFINFSWSHDGRYSSNLREKIELSDEYYDNVFKFIQHNHYGSHPMISYEGIKNSIENYKWWKEKYKEYGLSESRLYYLPMFLEVRNDGWNEESIQDYIYFLEYLLEDRLQMCNNNILELTKNLLGSSGNGNSYDDYTLLPLYNNDIIRLMAFDKVNTRFQCSMGHAICIKVNNLSIVPCHRMAYPHFEAATMPKKLNKPFDLKNNVNAYYAMTNANTIMLPGCVNCEYRFVCMKGCIGSQCETNGDYLVPIRSVCNLLRAKYDFLIRKYHEMGIFKCYFENPEFFSSKNSAISRRYLELLIRKGYNEYEQYL